MAQRPVHLLEEKEPARLFSGVAPFELPDGTELAPEHPALCYNGADEKQLEVSLPRLDALLGVLRGNDCRHRCPRVVVRSDSRSRFMAVAPVGCLASVSQAPITRSAANA